METTTTPANPYAADLVTVDPAKVDRMMKAPASQLDTWHRSIRNTIRGAKRAGAPRYLGRTAIGASIARVADALPIVDFAALPDGTLVRYEGGTHAHAGITS